MREALYWQSKDNVIRCTLCPRGCELTEGSIGFCLGRKVIGGKLMAINYSQVAAMALDPIEKKPLYHYNPGTMILSLGQNGCNLNCSFCQNWRISRHECPTYHLSIESLNQMVMNHHPLQVAFTYSEPLMWYEYIWDFARSYPEISIVLVSNAYLNEEPWTNLLPRIAAINVDLKSIHEDFYSGYCSASVNPVLRNIRLAHQAGVHLELTCLLIPGVNDNEQDITDLGEFISSVDKSIPLHISAYHPAYHMTIPATKTIQVKTACDIASRYLDRVYAGNVYLDEYRQQR